MMKVAALMGGTALLGAMTANERARGRYMRDEAGHAPAPTPAPAPAAEPSATPTPSAAPTDRFFDPNEDTKDVGEDDDSSGDPKPATSSGEADDEDSEHGRDTSEDQPGNTVEERIGKATAAQREAERQAAEARREADEWRRKAEAAEKPEGPQGKDVDVDAEPNANDYEFGEADPQYTRDLARFEARQEYQHQERQSRLKGELAGLDAKYEASTSSEDVKTRYPDFDEKVNKGAKENKWACPPLIALGIKDSDVGADIAYHLASNPEEARSIAGMNQIEQARAFGRLEGGFLKDAAGRAGDPAPKPGVKPSAAPTPPSSRARGAGGKFATEGDTDDFTAFKQMAKPIMNKGRH